MADDDSVVINAPSVEEAVILGLTRLTATRDEVEIEVLDEGSKGFLGIGARQASVRISRREVVAGAEPQQAPVTAEPSPVTSEPEVDLPADEPQGQPGTPETAVTEPASVTEAEAPKAEPVAPASQEPVAAPPTERAPRVTPPAEERQPTVTPPAAPPQEEAAPAPSDGLDRARLEEIVREIAAHLLPNMEIDVVTEWMEEERPTLWVALNGRDADALVGPRARNLHSIQYLFRALIYHKLDGEYNVVVDADGYRRRRRRSLESLAKDKADRAVELGRTIRLRPMPAHERRIVHMTLREDDRVSTESVGKGRDRAVTVIPQAGNGRGSGGGS